MGKPFSSQDPDIFVEGGLNYFETEQLQKCPRMISWFNLENKG